MSEFRLVNVRNYDAATYFDAEPEGELGRDAVVNPQNWRTVDPALWTQFLAAREELTRLQLRIYNAPKPRAVIVAGVAP